MEEPSRPEETKTIGDHDRLNINTSDAPGMRYWSDRLSVTEEDLREAVEAAGHTLGDVRRYLAEKKAGAENPNQD